MTTSHDDEPDAMTLCLETLGGTATCGQHRWRRHGDAKQTLLHCRMARRAHFGHARAARPVGD
eukprot:13718104-Alexandrium_andersonii.AAC.1